MLYPRQEQCVGHVLPGVVFNPQKEYRMDALLAAADTVEGLDHLAVIFGTLGIVFTLIGCTWTIAAKISGMATALCANTDKVNQTFNIIQAHAHDCDIDRAERGVKVDTHDRRLDRHSERLDGLEFGHS